MTDNDYNEQIIAKMRKIFKSVIIVTFKTKKDKEYINLPYIAGTTEILRRIFQKHKFRFTFYSSEIYWLLFFHTNIQIFQNKFKTFHTENVEIIRYNFLDIHQMK